MEQRPGYLKAPPPRGYSIRAAPQKPDRDANVELLLLMTQPSALRAGGGEVGPHQSRIPGGDSRRRASQIGRQPISSGPGAGSEAAFVIKLRRPARGPVVIILHRKTLCSGVLSRNPEIRAMSRKRRLLASEVFGVKRRRVPGPVRADPLRAEAGNHGNPGAAGQSVPTLRRWGGGKGPGVGNHDNPGVGLGRQILCVLSTRT